jgi:thiamine-phosphate pyrophosphorylase
VLLYYISDRTQFAGTEDQRRARLLDRIAKAAHWGIDFIQLREKDLCARDLECLARSAVEVVRASGAATRLLINSRTDVAIAVGADGVHLRSNEIFPEDVRSVWRRAGVNGDPVVAVSCHTEPEVLEARSAGAQFILLGPVFEKKDTPGALAIGLGKLHSASLHRITLFALGGVTTENAGSCIQAGAAGVAGIRLFQEGNLEETVRKLRALT